jgi:hypothetical protein
MFEGVGSLCLSLCKLSMFTSDKEDNKFGNKRDQAPIVPPLAEFPTQIQSTAACYFRELLRPVTGVGGLLFAFPLPLSVIITFRLITVHLFRVSSCYGCLQ